ncbi:MAG: helix-turn-helix domain-containing protein [Gemmatimonadaceae bacterium]
MNTTEERQEVRDTLIVDRYRSGDSLREVALAVKLSPERVRQILDEAGIVMRNQSQMSPGLLRRRQHERVIAKQREVALIREEAARVIADPQERARMLHLRKQGKTVREIGSAMGYSIALVRAALKVAV